MALGGISRTISFALALSTAGFNAGLNSAGANLRGFARASDESLRGVATGAGVMGAALGAAFALSVGKAMEFESAMSNVAAVSGATGAEFDRLRQQALDLGASSVFTATEAAQAQEELAKAGLTTAQILGGATQGTMDLAAAANMGMAEAATIAANAMNMFNLSAREVPHVADVIAASANKSAMSAADFGMAMKQAGSAANLTGMDFEETAASLAIFADSGIKGSDAGTSLRTMLLRLNPTTESARKEMEKYGLEFVDQEGNFKSMAEVAGELETKLGGLDTATRTSTMSTIFGQDAIRASALLYEAGADGVTSMTEAVDDSGYAAEVARIKMDNLSGDVEKLSGAFETMLVDSGSEATNTLRTLTQAATSTVDQINELPPVFAQVFIGATGIGSAAAIGVAGLGTFIPMARTVKGALEGMGGAAASLSSMMTMRAFAGLTAGAVGIGAAFVLVSSQIQGAKQRAQEANEVFVTALKPPTDMDTSLAYTRAIQDEIGRLQGVLSTASDAAGGFWDTYEMGSERFYEMINPFGEDTFTETMERIDDLMDKHHVAAAETAAYGEAVSQLGGDIGLTTGQVESFAAAHDVDLYGAVASSVAILAEEKDAVEMVNGVMQLTPAAMERVSEAVDNELRPALAAAAAEATMGAPVLIEMSGSMETLGDETATTSEKFDALSSMVSNFLGLAFSTEEATDRLAGRMGGLGEAVEAANYNFGGNSEETLKLRGEMRGAVDDAGALIQAWIETGVKGDDLRHRVNGLSTSLVEQAVRAGVSREEAVRYFGALNQLPDEVYTDFTSNQPAAIADAEHLSNVLDWATRDRRIQVFVETGGIPHALAGLNPGARSAMFGSANGNIFTPFADGGHYAQIAPAGAMRLWAEPETGGEAYIPLSPAKRGRSTEILRQTNAMMGSPLGGGTTVVDMGGVSVTVHAPNYVGDTRDLADAMTDAVRRDGRLQDHIATAATRAWGAVDGRR